MTGVHQPRQANCVSVYYVKRRKLTSMPREAKVGGGVWHEYILLLKKKVGNTVAYCGTAEPLSSRIISIGSIVAVTTHPASTAVYNY